MEDALVCDGNRLFNVPLNASQIYLTTDKYLKNDCYKCCILVEYRCSERGALLINSYSRWRREFASMFL